MDSIFKNEAKEKGVSVTDLKILVVLITRLVNGIESVEPRNKG
jgi:hypothetical protein